MNSLVGKSTGIALLMAAALLAALFAMGVFSATGVGADVLGGTQKPTVSPTSFLPDAEDFTLTVTFQITEAIADAGGGIQDVTVIVPTAFPFPDDYEDNGIEVRQDGEVVGDVTREQQTITIGVDISSDANPNVQAGTVILTIPGLSVSETPSDYNLDTERTVTVQQAGDAGATSADPVYVGGSVTSASVELDRTLPGVSDVTMELTFQTDTAGTAGNEVEITILSSDYDIWDDDASPPAVFETNAPMVTAPVTAAVTLQPADTGATPPVVEAALITVGGFTAGQSVQVKIPGLTNPAERTVSVTFAQGTQAPVEEATATVEDAPPFKGEVKLSSSNAGAAVQVTVKAYAGTAVTSASDITIDLKKFGVPSTIPERSVNITDDDGDGTTKDEGYSGEPNSVTVNGTKVTLALYTRFPGQNFDAGDVKGEYTVTIKQSAGVTNPILAGPASVVVKDADDADEFLSASIASQVKLSSKAGARGTAVTVSGVGIGKGGATVYLVQGNCPDQGNDPALVAMEMALEGEDAKLPGGTKCTEEDDISLGNGTVGADGKISVDIDTSSSEFRRGQRNPDQQAWQPDLETDTARA